MNAIVGYVRTILNSFGWNEDDPAIKTGFKRDRNEDEISSDDETPALKRLKKLRKTSFPDIMESKDIWEENKHSKNVRYVPIQLETGHPSTSTPNEGMSKSGNHVKTVPIKLVDVTPNGPSTPSRKPRLHTPVRPVIQAIIDDEDDNDQEVTWVETKPESKKPAKVYIDLEEDEDNDNDEQDDDVIFVKKVTTPPPIKPYKFFISKSHNTLEKDSNEIKYYKICRKPNERNSNLSPRTFSKFKAPAGITKVYKKPATPVARWMQTQRSLPLARSRLNGSARATLSEVFNLDEKRNYQELIRRFAGASPAAGRGLADLAGDSAALRLTQRAQRNALDSIKRVERGPGGEEAEAGAEYDPVTVASITSSDSEVEAVEAAEAAEAAASESGSSSPRAPPVNSLRDSMRHRAVTSAAWLAGLHSKYKKRHAESKERIEDARRESDMISKLIHEQRVAHLEHKLKHEFSIPESLVEEAPAAELPPLTAEQERLVRRALGPGPPDQLMVEKFNLRIHRRDLQTLAGLNWLNDEVINFYMNLLMQRSEESKDLPKVYAMNTFFYPKLMQSGQAGLRRWTRKVDIFAHALLLVPVHLGVHWCLSVVDFRRRRASYLDSMGAANQPCLDALLQYLRDEHRDKKGRPFDDSGWTAASLRDIPQQMNGSDCGMFACTFAEFASRDAPYSFTQADMPYLRRKAALEILQGRLML